MYRRRRQQAGVDMLNYAFTRSAEFAGNDGGSTLTKTLITNVWKSNKFKSGLLCWMIGLVFLLLAPGLKKLTPEMRQEYDNMVAEAVDIPVYSKVYANFAAARRHVDEAKVWFWRFREPHKSRVYKREKVAARWEKELKQLNDRRETKLTKAKQFAGIWSELGMQEMRDRFWNAFEQGKLFAQQQTFYQMIFQVISGRDESIVSIVLNWLFVALANFTTGLLGSLFYFTFSLIGLIYSYQPDPISAVAFFVLGLLGAASVVATYLVGMYGMAASGIYVIGKVAARDALEGARREHLRHEQQ